MNAAMSASSVDTVSAFLDDCNVKGQQSAWSKCWEYTLQVLKTLAEFGFMVDLHKCKFLTDNVVVLG